MGRCSPLTFCVLICFFNCFSPFSPSPPSKETRLVLRRRSCVLFSLVFFGTDFLSMHWYAAHVRFPEDSFLLHSLTSFLLMCSGNPVTRFHFRDLQGVFLTSFCPATELNLKLKSRKRCCQRGGRKAVCHVVRAPARGWLSG